MVCYKVYIIVVINIFFYIYVFIFIPNKTYIYNILIINESFYYILSITY